MASLLAFPFNFQPDNVSVKTSSYTIPAGKYAMVVVQVVGASTFTINAATALEGKTWSVLASDNLRIGTNSGDTGYLASGTTTAMSAAGGAFNETSAFDSASEAYWVPTGTIINGTGTWRAVVSEFNQIT